eukprot:19680_1
MSDQILIRFANAHDNESILLLLSEVFDGLDSVEVDYTMNTKRLSIVAESIKHCKLIACASVYDQGNDYKNKKYLMELKRNIVFTDEMIRKYCNDNGVNKADMFLRKDICEGDDLAVLKSYREAKIGSLLGIFCLFATKYILKKKIIFTETTKYSHAMWYKLCNVLFDIDIANKHDEKSRIIFADMEGSCKKSTFLLNSILKTMANLKG